MRQSLLLATLLFLSPAASAQPNTALPAGEVAIVNVIERSLPGLIFIEAIAPSGATMPFSSPLFANPREDQSSGSGFFVNPEGYALTNYHVVEGATRLSVRLLDDDTQYTARVVGSAPDYDLALIQVQNVPRNLIRPLPLGDSATVRAGQTTIALGAPFGLEFSASTGIVSAVGRSVPTGARHIAQNTIQTDAAINPGNSGGPLLNSAGQVIGVNTQILSPAGAASGIGQNAGVGFAVPIDVAKRLLPRLQSGETIVGPVIGVALSPVELEYFSEQARAQYRLPRQGALVSQVVPGGPAARAGLQGGTTTVNTPIGAFRMGGDVITAVNGQPIKSSADLRELLFNREAGDTVRLTVARAGQSITVPVTLVPGAPPPATRR